MGLLRLLGIEKYLKKVKTYVDDKVSIPNWDATATEKGFVENRTHYKNFGVWRNVSVVGSTATISGIDNYEYVLFKGVSSGQDEIKLAENTRYNVQFEGVGLVQITVVPANNNMIVAITAGNIDAHVFVNERIRPFNIVTIEQRYLPKGLTTKEYVDDKVGIIDEKIDNIKVPAPDWNAQEGEAGYIENKPFKVNSNYVLDINSYHTIINDEDTPIYVYLETECGQNTLVKCEKNSEGGTFDWYKFEVTKDKQYLPYYVESTGAFWESDDRIWNGSYIVNGDEYPCTFIQTDSIERCANRIICDYTLEDGILQTIPDTYIPDTIARKEYVDERFGELESNGMKYILSPFIINEGTKSLPNDMLRFFGTPLVDMTCIEISDSLSAIIRVKPTFIEDALDDAYYLVCNVKFNGQEYSKTYKVSRNGNIELI